MDPGSVARIRQGSYQSLISFGYTSFFLASKNFEVSPISLNDLTKVLLRGQNITKNNIVSNEFEIRKAVDYSNEVSTLFEFVMFYIKIWKVTCQ